MTQPITHSTTQNFLDLYDITNDLVILRDGTTSLIITVDAMNFGLLAEEEQDSIIYSYAGLLNSLNYPIQIIIDSQTKDVTGYLHLLKDQEDATTNPKMRQRIREYREFVANLIRERNVLDKRFYLAIPATSLELGLMTPQSVLPGSKMPDITGIERNVILEKAQHILEPKRDHLIAQFARIGLFSRQLTTQEIIQLFYVSYNPEAAEGQHLVDSSNYTTPLVTTGMEGLIMTNTSQPPFNNQDPSAQPLVPESPVAPVASDGYQPTQMDTATAVVDSGTTPPMDPTTSSSPVTAPAATPEVLAPEIPAETEGLSQTQPMAVPVPDLSQTLSAQPQIAPERIEELHAPSQNPTPVEPTPAMSDIAPMQNNQTIYQAPPAPLENTTTSAPSDVDQVQSEINQTLGQLGQSQDPVDTQEPISTQVTDQSVSVPPSEPVGQSSQPQVGGDDNLPEI
jgi:hypothetical protein